MLIECLFYMAMLMVVLGVATKAFYNCWDNSRALRRNADDIVRALHAGDQWRADVRAATGPIQLTAVKGVEQFRIPATTGAIVYTFSNGELRRQAGSPASDRVLLSNVQSSEMQSDLRQRVAAWRWELEIKSAQRRSRWRPLFTFETVAGGAVTR
jgi:hypothetical protein